MININRERRLKTPSFKNCLIVGSRRSGKTTQPVNFLKIPFVLYSEIS
jgi:predicted AAA+ superfamily ATPase